MRSLQEISGGAVNGISQAQLASAPLRVARPADGGRGVFQQPGIDFGGSRPPMVPYQPPHWGASWFDASILPISLLPQ